MKYFNYFFVCAIGVMFGKIIPQYQAAASVPNARDTYIFDTISNAAETSQAISLITPDYYSPEEKALETWSFFYNQNGQLNSMLTRARRLKGASVRAMLARDSTNDSPWMRVVYDDCSTGQCITRNFGHLEPKLVNGNWMISSKEYPDAFKRIMENRIWVLKARDDIPYNIREFVEEFYPLALEHERRYGIPWQVKLAQAGFESAWGKSGLARNANQYFGIKAPRGEWKGKIRLGKDEGGKHFAFTAHSDAAESFEYHSKFLKMYGRYKGVFEYKPDSMYNYTFKPLARYYWNTKLFKPVKHTIDGQLTTLVPGKTYRLSGIDCVTIELSRAGYGSDVKYSDKVRKTIELFSEPAN
jgi:hypothetical protein